uniref:Ribosomal protein S1 n=1 Tax=Antithamnionella ternifolia TaxID=207919 RepID=A0A4D6WJG2_9FLOR|nr:ribosomal protein S1 [Antithamnionella ternifolia]
MLNNVNFIDYKLNSILKKYNYNLHPGDIVAGTIFNIEKKGFLVNIGDTIAGYLPIEEISLDFNNTKNTKFFTNTTREFFIVAYNTRKKQLILSIKRLEYIRAWKRIKQMHQENIIFNLQVENLNKGGIITYIEGLQGFIPNSHILQQKNNHINTLNKFLQCKLLITDEKNNQIILSNKSALLYISQHKFKIGEIVYGKIKKIKNYGVFIEIHNILALLHISEIGSQYINNLYQAFNIAEIIKVKIIHIDFKQGRLSLSRKNLNSINHRLQ